MAHNTIGMYGSRYTVPDYAPYARSRILATIERGRASLKAITRSGTVALLRRPTRAETLSLMVDALGLDGARDYIATTYHCTGQIDSTVAALHVPKDAVFAVVVGSFPDAVVI